MKFGLNCKVYWSATALDKSTYQPTPGTIDAQSLVDTDDWVENANIKNLTLPMTREQFDTTLRETGGIKTSAGTLLSTGIDCDMMWRPGDGGAFDDFLTKVLTLGGEITLMILDGPIDEEGSRGLVANFSVETFDRDESLPAVVMTKAKLVPASYPDWYVVPAP